MQLEVDAVEFKQEQKRLAEVHRSAWEEDIKEKRRLEKMTDAKDRLAQDIMTRRAAEFARLNVSDATPHQLCASIESRSPQTQGCGC